MAMWEKVAPKPFAAKVAKAGTDASAVVAALDEAFGKTMMALVPWVAGVLQDAAGARRP